MKSYKWHANAEIIRVIDGDSFKAKLDLGWRVFVEAVVRLADLNAPELDTAAGLAAGARLKELLPTGAQILVISTRIDKYGRAAAFIRMPDGSDLGALLVAEGHAVGCNDRLEPRPYRGPPETQDGRALGTLDLAHAHNARMHINATGDLPLDARGPDGPQDV
jgi:endonuclease YncB( thermonuclease family)